MNLIVPTALEVMGTQAAVLNVMFGASLSHDANTLISEMICLEALESMCILTPSELPIPAMNA